MKRGVFELLTMSEKPTNETCDICHELFIPPEKCPTISIAFWCQKCNLDYTNLEKKIEAKPEIFEEGNEPENYICDVCGNLAESCWIRSGLCSANCNYEWLKSQNKLVEKNKQKTNKCECSTCENWGSCSRGRSNDLFWWK